MKNREGETIPEGNVSIKMVRFRPISKSLEEGGRPFKRIRKKICSSNGKKERTFEERGSIFLKKWREKGRWGRKVYENERLYQVL